MVAVGDHLRLPAQSHHGEVTDATPGAVYRVVGTVDGKLSLLKVTDADGRRRYTGEVRQIDRETVDTAFVQAANPDGGLALRHPIRSIASGLYWSIRRFLP